MNRFSCHITALMLALTIGLHWTALQSVAWVTMLVEYSAETSFSDAVVKTFDGRHPCKLCLAVEEGRKSDSNQKQLLTSIKADWLLVASDFSLIPPAFDIAIPSDLSVPDSFGRSPPVPPPRHT